MQRIIWMIWILATGFSVVYGAECPIVPQPKEFQTDGTCWTLDESTTVGIQIASNASQVVHYAAERLQTLLARRFHRTIPILSGEISPNVALTQVFTLSLRQDGERKHNGFSITFSSAKDGTLQQVCIQGDDENGLIYGSEALFSLFKKEGDTVQILTATVRDWPSIPWRGRPHSVVAHHLEPGQMDAYVHARLNFSDYRDDPTRAETVLMPARKSSMGCPPGKPLDESLLQQALGEFHRRGFFVYGVVSCAVPPERYASIMQTFDQLRQAGCDGVWLSMDDSGGGEKPVELARYFAEYLQKQQIPGTCAAFTPPPEEYQNIDRPLNRELAKIPTFCDVAWIFTRVPCAADARLAQEIGLKQKPVWWFNYCETAYPDPKGGFLHSSSVLTTQRKDGRPSYVNLLPITPGWGTPNFAQIRDADQYTDRVLLWALCGGWPTEYALGMFGAWAWNPQDCDWPRLRDAIYDHVWGPSQVATIREFDTQFAQLKTLYWLPENWKFRAPNNSLVRLRTPENRAEALRILDHLDTLAERLANNAPQESTLDAQRLERCYLEPMRTTLFFARKQATLEYPEYTYATFEKTAETIRAEQGNEAAEAFLHQVREQVAPMLETLSRELAPLKDIEPVLDLWRKRIATPASRG